MTFVISKYRCSYVYCAMERWQNLGYCILRQILVLYRVYFILRQKLLHFGSLLHIASNIITFWDTITFCVNKRWSSLGVNHYILWRNNEVYTNPQRRPMGAFDSVHWPDNKPARRASNILARFCSINTFSFTSTNNSTPSNGMKISLCFYPRIFAVVS